MHFVDDINFIARACGCILHRIDNLANIVHAGAACRVHFNDIDMPVFRDGDAACADAAWLLRRPALPIRTQTVQAAGNDARGGGFADPANAREQKRMRQPPGFNRIAQRAHQHILPNQFREGSRAVFAGENAVGGLGHIRFQRLGFRCREKYFKLLTPEP